MSSDRRRIEISRLRQEEAQDHEPDVFKPEKESEVIAGIRWTL